MDLTEMVAMLVLGALGVLAVIARREGPSFKSWLAGHKRTPLGRLQSAYARVTGRAQRAEEVLTAPISGQACLAFVVRLDEAHGRAARSLEIRSAEPFWIVDDTGRALVRSAEPHALALDRALEGTIGESRPLAPEARARLLALLEARGHEPEAWLVDGVHYEEALLAEDEMVSVGGRSTLEPDPTASAGLSRRVPMRRVLLPTPEAPILITDDADVHAGY